MNAPQGMSADEGRNALDGLNDFINGLMNTLNAQFNRIEWDELDDKILNSKFVTKVTEAFNSINWGNIEAELFTARDKVSERVVDAYEKARQKLREMPTCEIHGDPADDSSECHTAKKLYVQTQRSIEEMKRKINEIKAASDTTPSRLKRALDVERRIEQIEQNPIRNNSEKTVAKLILLYTCLLASFLL